MFITRNAFISPVSALFSNPGEHAWFAVELALQQIWFLVQLEEIEDEDKSSLSCDRTVLLFDFQSVEDLINAGHESSVRFKAVHIVTPAHVNGGEDWQMTQLSAVWHGKRHVEEHEVTMDIYETISGKKYPAFFCDLSLGEVAGDTLRLQFE